MSDDTTDSDPDKMAATSFATSNICGQARRNHVFYTAPHPELSAVFLYLMQGKYTIKAVNMMTHNYLMFVMCIGKNFVEYYA